MIRYIVKSSIPKKVLYFYFHYYTIHDPAVVLNSSHLYTRFDHYLYTVLYRRGTGRAGNLLICFLSELLVFSQKVSEWAIRSKKWAIRSFAHFWWVAWAIRLRLLIFGEQTEQIAHGCSFLVSDLSDSLTSLRGNEQRSCFWQQKSDLLRKPWANSHLCWNSVSPLPPENLYTNFSQSLRKFIK